jgi:hypothetical protein
MTVVEAGRLQYIWNLCCTALSRWDQTTRGIKAVRSPILFPFSVHPNNWVSKKPIGRSLWRVRSPLNVQRGQAQSNDCLFCCVQPTRKKRNVSKGKSAMPKHYVVLDSNQIRRKRLQVGYMRPNPEGSSHQSPNTGLPYLVAWV